ncbi:MAG: helix-turn-helix transcriptional regulator [Syntrophorhabdus sp.]|nr:helix-turn-helix transcriptional regulator [Syntrophorhabdus sp.]
MSSEKDDKLTTLGERLRHIRKQLRFNQQQLADYVGLKSATAISLYENNKREPEYVVLDTLYILANVNLTWLISGVGPVFCNSSGKENEKGTVSEKPEEYQTTVPNSMKKVHDAFMEVMLSNDEGTKLALTQNIFTFQRTVRSELKVSKLESDIEDIKRALKSRDTDFKTQESPGESRQPGEKHRVGGE